MQKTRYVNSQTGSAVNEKQEIRLSSIKHPEVQVSRDAESSNNILINFQLKTIFNVVSLTRFSTSLQFIDTNSFQVKMTLFLLKTNFFSYRLC